MILDVRDLHAGYDEFMVLQGVDLSVREGQILCVIGPNGAGKSTLFNCLFGLLEPSRGRIEFDGEDIGPLDPGQRLTRGLSYVLQRDAVFQDMTVEKNLRMGAYLAPRGYDLDARLAAMYDLFPILERKADQKAGALSGGQRQMVELARGLMLDPDLLLLDEPTAGLAPKVIDGVFEKIHEINEQGVTILMIEQNIQTGLEYADYAYVLENGQTVYHGPADTVTDQPEIAEAYLGEYVDY